MRDLQQWLDEHNGELEAIAKQHDTTASLVRLATVLAFQGLTDAALSDQLKVVQRRLASDEHRLLSGARRALPQIRMLLVSSDDERIPETRLPSPRLGSRRGRPLAGAMGRRQKEPR